VLRKSASFALLWLSVIVDKKGRFRKDELFFRFKKPQDYALINLKNCGGCKGSLLCGKTLPMGQFRLCKKSGYWLDVHQERADAPHANFRVFFCIMRKKAQKFA
jgi:hypothetical protein